MKVYKLFRQQGPVDTDHLRFVSRKDAITQALKLEKAYHGKQQFRRDSSTGKFLIEEMEMRIRVDEARKRVMSYNDDGQTLVEAELMSGGYFALEDTKTTKNQPATP